MQPSSPSGTVLVVEGDELVLRSCADMLSAAGLKVRTALQGAAALHVLGEGADIHVVLANVELPDLGGAELLRAIRERDAELPVIFVTRWPSFGPGVAAADRAGGTPNSAEALRGSVVTAAVGYRVGQRARRRTLSPASPLEGE